MLQSPIVAIENQIFILQNPIVAIENPIFILQDPIVAIENPIFILQDPIVTIENPIFILQDPIIIIYTILLSYETSFDASLSEDVTTLVDVFEVVLRPATFSVIFGMKKFF